MTVIDSIRKLRTTLDAISNDAEDFLNDESDMTAYDLMGAFRDEADDALQQTEGTEQGIAELLAACQEVLRNCELFRTADNMADRLCRIVEPAIAAAQEMKEATP